MRRTLSAPPPGPPWDLPVDQAPLVLVDLEMTGLDFEHDYVVEVCLERWIGDRLEQRVESLVRPPSRAGGNAHVHGLDAAELATAPAFAEIAPRIEAILAGGIVVAHAAEWDVGFLRAELRRAGRPFEMEYFIDTLVLSRRAFALPNHSLDALCTAFSIDRGRAHRAGADVRALHEVLTRCIAGLAPKSARDLWEVRVAERMARPAIVAACARAAELGRPVAITYRPSHRGAQELVLIVQELQLDASPPRIVGYELPSRSRRTLRTDRILQVEDSP